MKGLLSDLSADMLAAVAIVTAYRRVRCANLSLKNNFFEISRAKYGAEPNRRDTLRLLGATEIHCNRAVYVSLNTLMLTPWCYGAQ